MNRKSLFGRLSPRTLARRTADRPEHYRAAIEPLEVRKVLAATFYVNDNWAENPNTADGTLTLGDSVVSLNDPVNFGITATYGTNAFGNVTGTNVPNIAGNEFIYSAITAALDDNNDTVSIIEGTYTESDIVIDKSVIFQGSGRSGLTDTLIVPEVASARAEQEFPIGSRSGIIIYNNSITVRNLRLDGSGNGSITPGFAYHHGITTFYEQQNGPGGGSQDYVSLRAGNLSVTNAIANYGGIVEGLASLRPKLFIQSVTVQNAWYHGITFSGPTGTNFDEDGSGAHNEVANSIVTNVGDAGNQGFNHVGIMIMNVDDYDTGDPGGAPASKGGNAYDNVVSNAGIGIGNNAYGTRGWSSDDAAQNDSTYSFNTVNNPVVAAYYREFNNGNDFINNVATFAPGNTAIGIWNVESDLNMLGSSLGTSAANAPLIGLKLEKADTAGHGTSVVLANSLLQGPGTAVSGSIGILADNTFGVDTDTTFLASYLLEVTNFETGVKINQSNASTVATNVFLDRLNVHGNGTGYDFGPTDPGGSVIIHGQFNTPDPVTDPGTTILGQFLPNILETYADALTNQPVPPTSPATNVTPPVPTVSDVTEPKPDIIRTGNLTLTGDAIFAPLLNGDPTGPSTVVLADFGSSFSYGIVSDIDHVNPWNTGFLNPARLGLWSAGQTIQNGDGTIQIGNSGGGASEIGALLNLGTTPFDITEMGYMELVAKKGVGTNTAKEFLVGVSDLDGTTDLHYFPIADMTTDFQTFTQNILIPPVRFVDGDGISNLSAIAGWSMSGAFGSTSAVVTRALSVVVDEIRFVAGPRQSQFDVTGTVNLTGAILAPSNGGKLYVSSAGQTFTIINNDGGDAVVGTFAGLAEGATLTVGSDTYAISYTGGDGNDVVLTQQAPSGSIAGRHIFYNQSFFDGNTAGFSVSDDSAIDPVRSAYLPGAGNAVDANITGYDKGINGIMIDIANAGSPGSISAADFVFKVGNNNTPGSWGAAPAPSSIQVRTGAGVSGSDRVDIIWANNAIQKQWLEVQVLANGNTGLPDNFGGGIGDVFFWGNAVGDGDTGNTATAAPVNATDEIGARNNPHSFGNPATVDDQYDYNKDRFVNATDQLISRNNSTNFLTQLVKINVGTGGPFAPEGGDSDGDGDAGIASALAGKGSSSDEQALPTSVGSRLASAAPAAAAADDAGLLLEAEDLGGDDDDSVDEDVLDSLVEGL